MRPAARLSAAAAVAVALSALALPAGSASADPPWSAPAIVGEPSSFVASPQLAFAPSGPGLLSWTAVTGTHLAAWPSGSAPGVPTRVRGTFAAGPAPLPDGRFLVLRERTLSTDGNFTARVRLSASFATPGGRPDRERRLAAFRSTGALASATSPQGRIAVAWIEALRPRRGDLEQRARLRLVLGSARTGRFSRPRTVADVAPVGHPDIFDVDIAFGADGALLVAYTDGFRERRRGLFVKAVTRTREGRLRRQSIGRHRGVTELVAGRDGTGRAVVAWSTQDGGEEANEPAVVRAAVREPGAGRFAAAQLLDPGQAASRTPGRLAVGQAADGTTTVLWSNVTGRRYPYTFPVRVATAAPGAPFAAAQELDGNGAAGSVAVAPDGATLVAWSRITRGNEQEPDQVFAALRPAGAPAFGAPEAVSPSEVATQPHAAFDPVTGRARVVWAGRPGGRPPEEGADRSAVVRVATREGP